MNSMSKFALIAASLVLAPTAMAQSNDCAKLSAGEPVVDDLSADEFDRPFGDCPAVSMIGMAGNDAAAAFTTAFVQKLHEYRYGLLDENGQPTDAPIREFQLERGDPVTGILTVRQVQEIGNLPALKSANIWIDGGTSPFGDDGDKPDLYLSKDHLSFSGSWWIDGPVKIMDPLNKHVYECDLANRVCQHAGLSFVTFADEQLDARLFMNTLKISRVELPVVEIVPFDQPCRRPVITVNVEREEVIEVTTQVSQCPLMNDLLAPRIARLRSPSFQSKEYREAAESDLLARSSKRFKARIAEMMDNAPSETK